MSSSTSRTTWTAEQASKVFDLYASPQHPLLAYDRVMRYHAHDFGPYIQLTGIGNGADVRILDMGCGTGFLSFALAKVMSGGSSLVGIDCCERLLDRAKEKKAVEAPGANVEFQLADITNTTSLHAALGDDKFDIIVSSWTIFHLPLPAAVVKLWAQHLLRPHGTLVLDIAHPGDATNVFCIWKEESDLAPGSQLEFVPSAPHQDSLPSSISLADSTTHAECKAEAASFAKSAGLLLDCHPVKAYSGSADRQDWARTNAAQSFGSTRASILAANTQWVMNEEERLHRDYKMNTAVSNYKYGRKVDAVIARFIRGGHVNPNDGCPCGKSKKFKQCHQGFSKQ